MTTTTNFTTITPKEESAYDRMIREKQEAQLEGCCEGGWLPRSDYKPRPASAPTENPPAEAAFPKNATDADRKNIKRPIEKELPQQ